MAALGTITGLGLVLGVEMLRATFVNLPTPALALRQGWNGETLLACLLWLYALALAWAALTAWGFTRPQVEADGLWEAIPSPFRAPARLSRRIFMVAILNPLGRRSRNTRRGVGLLLLAASAAPILLIWWSSTSLLEIGIALGLSEGILALFEVSLTMLEGWGLALGMMGLWMLAASFDRAGNPKAATLAVSRALAVLVVSGTFGAALWFMVDAPWNPLTWRAYTMWAAVHIGLVTLAAGRVADGVGHSLTQRLLIAACMLALVAGAVALPVPVGYNALHQTTSKTASRDEARFDFPNKPRPTGGAITDDQPADVRATPSAREWQKQRAEAWFNAVQARIGGHKDEPVIFLAAAGGGSRSALYSTLVLEALERTPTHGDFGDWSKPEETGAEGDDEPSRSLADRLVFISSVSGGSVANAHYSLATERGELARSNNTLPGELRHHLLAEVKDECDRQWSRCADEAGSPQLSCLETDNRKRSPWQCVASGKLEGGPPILGRGPQCTRFVRLCASPESKLPGANEGFNPQTFMVNIDKLADNEHLRWPVDSKRFDELSTDFTAPLLRGMVYPGIERGESVSAFWASEFDWQDRWRAHPERARAVMLMNIADVKTGAGVVAGFPDLPPGLLRKQMYMDGHTGTAWIQAASGARALADIHAHLEVDVEEAVRMSANFPYGFDLPRLGLGEDLTERALVVDGGVLDNTGISTFAVLMERLQLLANPLLTDEVDAPLRDGARVLLDDLARRGVVLLEVDSGGKPLEPSRVEKALANLLLPLHSLSTASFVRASEATRQDVRRMEEILTWRANALGTQPPSYGGAGSRMRHVRYVLDTEGLMTAWGLTPKQKGHVMARFLAEDVAQREVLRDAYEDLEGRNRLNDVLGSDLADDPALTRLVTELAGEEHELAVLRNLENESSAARRATSRASKPSVLNNNDGELREQAPRSTGGEKPLVEGWIALGFHLPSHVDATRAAVEESEESEESEGSEGSEGSKPLSEEDPEVVSSTLLLVDSVGCGEVASSSGLSPWLLTHVRIDRAQAPCTLLGEHITLADPLVVRAAQPDPSGRLASPVHLLESGTRVRFTEVGLWPGSGYVFAHIVQNTGDIDTSHHASE